MAGAKDRNQPKVTLMEQFMEHLADVLYQVLRPIQGQAHYTAEHVKATIQALEDRVVTPPSAPAKLLGKGVKGSVFATTNLNGKEVALKTCIVTRRNIRDSRYSTAYAGLVEIALAIAQTSYGVKANNIQQYLDVSFTAKEDDVIEVQLVSELMQMDVMDYIYCHLHAHVTSTDLRGNDTPCTYVCSNQLYQMAVQTASGLEQLHTLRILHTDIKPPNMLVRGASEEQPVFVLADMGAAQPAARQTAPSEPLTSYTAALGTDWYMGQDRLDRRQNYPSIRYPEERRHRWTTTEQDDCTSWAASMLQAALACDPVGDMQTWLRDSQMWRCVWAQSNPVLGPLERQRLFNTASKGATPSQGSSWERYWLLESLRAQGPAGEATWKILTVMAFALCSPRPTAHKLVELLRQQVEPVITSPAFKDNSKVELKHVDFPNAMWPLPGQQDNSAAEVPSAQQDRDEQAGEEQCHDEEYDEEYEDEYNEDEPWEEEFIEEEEHWDEEEHWVEEEHWGEEDEGQEKVEVCQAAEESEAVSRLQHEGQQEVEAAKAMCSGWLQEGKQEEGCDNTPLTLCPTAASGASDVQGWLADAPVEHTLAEHQVEGNALVLAGSISPRFLVASDPGGPSAERAVVVTGSISHPGHVADACPADTPSPQHVTRDAPAIIACPASQPKQVPWWCGLFRLCWGSTSPCRSLAPADELGAAACAHFNSLWNKSWAGC